MHSPARIAFVVLPLVAMMASACNRATEKPAQAAQAAQPVLTVSVEPAASQVLTATLTLTGAIAAWQPLSVSPAANGLHVVAVLAEEGQHVAKGQALARLDDRSVRTQLADTRARLASAEASLQKARFPGRSEDVSSASASLTEADARLRSAQADYDRFAILRAEGAVTAPELDAKTVALASARAARQLAYDRLTVMRDGGRREDVRVAEAAVAQARAAVAQSELQLTQTQVVAPAAGLILAKDVLLGDVAAVGKAMFTLARDNRLEMTANVAESDMAKVKPGQAVALASDASPGLKATGTVRQVSPSLDTTSRLATVRIDLPVGTGFKPGMFARGQVSLGRTSMLAVPLEAVVSQDGRSRVFVVTNGVAHAREVVTGENAGEWTPIKAGLQPGESVATEGAGFLKEGDPVAVANVPNAATPARRQAEAP